jgi:hypothetical protein
MKQFLFLSLIIIWGCSPRVTTQTSMDNKPKPLAIEVIISDTDIKFTVTNNLDDTVFIHHHAKLNIERYSDDNWNLLRILPCPCGAPCAKPAEFIELPKGEKLSYSWNREESWCGEMRDMPVPETITERVSNGKYRYKIYYSLDQRQVNEYYKEFILE